MKCDWTENSDPDYWETSCGEAFIIIEGTPQDNKMKYCPFCGQEINTGEKQDHG
jgi:hypothetical protein